MSKRKKSLNKWEKKKLGKAPKSKYSIKLEKRKLNDEKWLKELHSDCSQI